MPRTSVADRPIIGSTLGIDSPRARKTDPITSQEAADATAGSVAHSQAAVLSTLARTGPLSDVEIVDWLSVRGEHLSDARIRSARNELVERGYVMFSGMYHLRTVGVRQRRHQVWMLTPAGQSAHSKAVAL
jgi:hypothetical protein